MRALLLDFEGRIGRARYWLGTVLLVLASLPWAVYYVSAGGVALAEQAPAWLDAGDLVMSLLLAWPACAVATKRARDAGLPVWLGVVSAALMVAAAATFFVFGSGFADVESSTGDLLGAVMLIASGLVALWLGIAPTAGSAAHGSAVASSSA